MDYPFGVAKLTTVPEELLAPLEKIVRSASSWSRNPLFVRTYIESLNVNHEPQHLQIKELVEQIGSVLEPWLPFRKFKGFGLNLLPAGKEIAEHSDINTGAGSKPMEYITNHKVHIPILTGPEVTSAHRRSTRAPKEPTDMVRGNAYLYNDYIWHSARNNGEEPRVHLIIQYTDPDWSDRLRVLKQLGYSEWQTYESS